jgi:hypothetical protein
MPDVLALTPNVTGAAGIESLVSSPSELSVPTSDVSSIVVYFALSAFDEALVNDSGTQNIKFNFTVLNLDYDK